jgi:hypothetical protein
MPLEKDAARALPSPMNERVEFRRRLDLAKNFKVAIQGLIVAHVLSPFLVPNFPRVVFILGILVAAGSAWLYCWARLGCPRCGFSRFWSERCACCGQCGLRVKGVALRRVRPFSQQHQRRWAHFPKRQRLWNILHHGLVGLLLLELAGSLLSTSQNAHWGTAVLAATGAVWIIARMVILRCPSCDTPLDGGRKEQFCSTCGTASPRSTGVQELPEGR